MRRGRHSVRFLPILRLLRGISLLLALMVLPSYAADEDVGGGFFSYLPAVPKIELPNIDIVPFWTDDLKRGKRNYVTGHYRKALDAFHQSSDDGNMIADWYLGHMYRLGKGVAPDQAVAFSYYSRVAENFDSDEPDINRLKVMVDSQLQVANYQRSGLSKVGLRPNPQLAARTFLRLGTAYAHPGALYALGVMNIEGEGMAKNPQQGLKWLNAAVRKHSPEAAAYLAELYQSGSVVKHDETRALMWYTIAAQAAVKDDNPLIFSRLDELRFAATDETRLEAEARARVWSEQNPNNNSQ
jgi:uncharacterized protein